VVITGMECQTNGGWIGGGSSVAACEAACFGSPFFQRMDGGDLNCRCCTADLSDSELVAGNDANIYRNALVAMAPDPVLSGLECATSLDWLNLEDRSTQNCAAACASHSYFQRMSLGGGDDNCKCCDQALSGSGLTSTNLAPLLFCTLASGAVARTRSAAQRSGRAAPQ